MASFAIHSDITSRTLLFGATDTSGGTTARILQSLAEHPDIQDRLRQEVSQSGSGDELSYDELMELPLLDAVVRETMRL